MVTAGRQDFREPVQRQQAGATKQKRCALAMVDRPAGAGQAAGPPLAVVDRQEEDPWAVVDRQEAGMEEVDLLPVAGQVVADHLVVVVADPVPAAAVVDRLVDRRAACRLLVQLLRLTRTWQRC